METLRDLFEDQIKDLYSAEQQLIKALPKMAKKASTEELQRSLQNHLKETEQQAGRLEKIGQKLDFKVSGKKCKAMEGLIAEGKEVLEEDGNELVIDAAIVAAAQRVEHYEISAYGTAIAIAEKLQLSEAVSLLQETLEEEEAADEKLTDVCVSEILESAPTGDEEMEEDEDEIVPVRANRMKEKESERRSSRN